MPTLFDPVTFGALDCPNRIIMAPLTRGRATSDRIPTERMARYYALRASAGLIISEATAISPMGYGWLNAPAMYTDAQQHAWQTVTDAVHQAGGRMVLQLWHMGRISHPDFLDGEQPVAPSAIAAEGEAHTPNGKQPFVVPREMTIEDIQSTVQDYVQAARRAKAAGFDGVEIHAANGYLLDEFLRDGSNHRTDAYGGSAENRCRFLLEILEAVCPIVGHDRVGVRISPVTPRHDMRDSNPVETFTTMARLINRFELAYLHIMEARPGHMLAPKDQTERVTPAVRQVYTRPIIGCGGYTRATASTAIEEGLVDAVAFGVPYIANPDLVERFRQNARLNNANMATFYTPGDEGYLDYPLLQAVGVG